MLDLQMVIRSAVGFLQKSHSGKINKAARTRCVEELHRLLPHVDRSVIMEKLTVRSQNAKRKPVLRKTHTDDGNISEYELYSEENVFCTQSKEGFEEAEDFDNAIESYSIQNLS